MLQQDLLLALSEVSVTIAALSAVAGVVKSDALNRISSKLLRDVAIVGLLVALFSLLPLIFWDDSSNFAFRLIALSAAITWLLGYIGYLRGVLRDRSQVTTPFWMGLLITVGGIVLFGMAALSERPYPGTSYLVALLAWLAIGGLNFVVSVFWTVDSDDA